MKIYFLGSVINDRTFDDIVTKSKVKPSNSQQNFENMLVKGLISNGIQVECHCIPAMSAFPGGNLIYWGRRKENLSCNKQVLWLPAINVQILKQISITISTFFSILYWLIRNRKQKEKTVLTYSIYPPFVIPMISLCRLFKCKSTVIITDLPEYMYKLRKQQGVVNLLKKYFGRKVVSLQGKFDNYILLTKQMKDRMRLEDRPTIVIEGFSDPDTFKEIPKQKKNSRKTIMYAGALNKSFGIDKLIDGFMLIKDNYELWLYGAGDCEELIKENVKKDDRIKYFGKVNRKELLTAQKKSHLLVSIKPSYEDHANYAFPSKILEYMTSGTAVLSTKVGGIPNEYHDYLYIIEDESPIGVKTIIEKVLSLPEEELISRGEIARKFVLKEKNYIIQSKKIIEFIMHEFE